MTDALREALAIVEGQRIAINESCNDLAEMFRLVVELYELPPSNECLSALSGAADLESKLFDDCSAAERLAELLQISEEFAEHDTERLFSSDGTDDSRALATP